MSDKKKGVIATAKDEIGNAAGDAKERLVGP